MDKKALRARKNEEKDAASIQSARLASQDSTHMEGGTCNVTELEKLLGAMEKQIIDDLSARIASNHATIAKHDQTIKGIEEAMTDHETRVTSLEATVTQLLKENTQLLLKTDDLENRSRRCNIRITGIPEGCLEKQPLVLRSAQLHVENA